jgi:hypothetical protein
MEGTVELREPDPDPEPEIDRPVDDVPPESAEPGGRRYPSTLGGACYLLVLVVSGVGLGIVAHGDWRLGVRCISAALGFGAAVRLVMPAQQAGMLAVRRRVVDVVILVVLAAALWFLSANIPNQPPL